MAELSHYLERHHQLTTLTAIEQELRTTVTQPTDFTQVKEAMHLDAIQRLEGVSSEDERQRAHNILYALPHAKTAEHLFNIAVYDAMHGKLEFRGTPHIYGVGYYDMPGNIEFRTRPQPSPEETSKTYARLLDTILTQAKRFGLKVKWRGEQLNLSVWRGERNITSIASGVDRQLAAQILMGILDTNEDVRPLMSRQPDFGARVSCGPTRLDTIRIVNESSDTRHHRFEQRDDFHYDIMLNVSHRLLMMLDGVVKGVNIPELGKLAKPIRAVSLKPANREEITLYRLQETFRGLRRIEVDGKGCPANIDELFATDDKLFGHGRMGAIIARELMGRAGAHGEVIVKKFFKAIRFTDDGMVLPSSPPAFQALSDVIGRVKIESVRLYDSLKFSGVLVHNQLERQRRLESLRVRWGDEIFNTIAIDLQRYKGKSHVQGIAEREPQYLQKRG